MTEPTAVELESTLFGSTVAVRPKADLSPIQLMQLTAPLNASRVSTRKQAGTTLSYVEAWDIKRTLIRVFGFLNFSADMIDGKILQLNEIEVPDTDWVNEGGKNRKVPKRDADGKVITKLQWRAVAQATVRLTIHETGATYTEMAISSQNGIDPGEVADFAIKTAESDALKRAAIYLGTQFGLSLYDNGSHADVVVAVKEPGQMAALRMQREKMAAENRDRQNAIAAGRPMALADQPEEQDQPGRSAPAEAPLYDEAPPMTNEEAGQLDPPKRAPARKPATQTGRGAVSGAFRQEPTDG